MSSSSFFFKFQKLHNVNGNIKPCHSLRMKARISEMEIREKKPGNFVGGINKY
jgi:hypothetical protein